MMTYGELARLSQETGIRHDTLWTRYQRGDRDEKLIRPVQIRRDMKMLAATASLPLSTLYQRWRRGDRGDRLTRPLQVKRTRLSDIESLRGGVPPR